MYVYMYMSHLVLQRLACRGKHNSIFSLKRCDDMSAILGNIPRNSDSVVYPILVYCRLARYSIEYSYRRQGYLDETHRL